MREYLSHIRKEKGFTQKQVASNTGISRPYYARIENGSRQKNLNIQMAAKLAELFEVSLDYVIQQETTWRGKNRNHPMVAGRSVTICQEENQ